MCVSVPRSSEKGEPMSAAAKDSAAAAPPPAQSSARSFVVASINPRFVYYNRPLLLAVLVLIVTVVTTATGVSSSPPSTFMIWPMGSTCGIIEPTVVADGFPWIATTVATGGVAILNCGAASRSGRDRMRDRESRFLWEIENRDFGG